MMHPIIMKIALFLFFVAVALAQVPPSGPQADRGKDMNISVEPRDYNLTTFGTYGYTGQATVVQADHCVSMERHDVETPRSIAFSGRNCCMFFPTRSCDNMLRAQRVVGNVPDTSVWGFPNGPAAVKCLSVEACEVLRHHACALDVSCSTASQQGLCPFESSCTEYGVPQPKDWQRYVAPPSFKPIRMRYYITDDGALYDYEGDENDAIPMDDADENPVALPGSVVPGDDNIRGKQGGLEDYSHPTHRPRPLDFDGVMTKEQQRQAKKLKDEARRERKKVKNRIKNEAKALKKAQFKKLNEDRKAQKNNRKPVNVAKGKVNGGKDN